MDEFQHRYEEMLRKTAAEERHHKSHVPAAAFFGVASGTVGTGIIGISLLLAKQNCFTGLLTPLRTGGWCSLVNPLQLHEGTYLIIGLILGALGYLGVYAYYYFVEHR